jgi:hypothetical protein
MKPLQLLGLLLSAALLSACGGSDSDDAVAVAAESATDDANALSAGAVGPEFSDGLMAVTDPTPIDEIAPAPGSIGADIPASYFGPSPSEVQKELIGPYQLMNSGVVDQEAGTITMPLYRGQLRSGEAVWYVLTDTDDAANAAALGINHSSKLTYARVGRGSRPATQQFLDGRTVVVFERGRVDFRPEPRLVPGAASPFPPQVATPGSVGDADYSPLATIDGYVYNAPIVAFDVSEDALNAFCEGNADKRLVHDKVVSICPREQTVTLRLTTGFSFARPVLYLSLDASDDLPATLEEATVAPGLRDIDVGNDDSAFSAVERIFLVINGPTNDVEGEVNPQRQGLNSAIRGEGGPLNVLGGIPTVATDYSPLWDLNVGEWTQAAIDNDYRSRVREEFEILGMVVKGHMTGPGGGTYGSTGFIVNCPIVLRFL